MNEQPTSLQKKRGPKPIGDATMSAAERKRRSRARKAAEGRAEFMVSLAGDTLAFVDRFAQHNGVTRSQVIQEFLDMAIAKVRGAVAHADQMMTSGASEQEIQAHLHQTFSSMAPQKQNKSGGD